MNTTKNDQNPPKNDHAQQLPTLLVSQTKVPKQPSLGRTYVLLAVLLVALFGAGVWIGYLLADHPSADELIATTVSIVNADLSSNRVGLPDSYTLPVTFGDVGPQLVASGAIDFDRFVQLYEQAGQPLTEEQLHTLTKTSNTSIVLDETNAYFLLNFLWALGLANSNPILEDGLIPQYMEQQGQSVESLASTGGWTLGTKPVDEIYASTKIITLTSEQQTRLEEVVFAVFRPCCNNPTAFPDCNHGMAMLGLLELMASQDVSADDMFAAAKYVNAFWFPQQTYELALFFQTTRNLNFAEIDARQLVGADFSSASGFRAVHQQLLALGKLDQDPTSGASCGV